MKQILLTFALFFSTYYPIAAQNHPFLPFQQGKLVGFKDSTDKIHIPPTFDYALPFSDGLALVRKGNDIYFINEQGKKAFPFSFDMAEPFENGRAFILKNGKVGIIDTKGETILATAYDYISDPYKKRIYILGKGNKQALWNSHTQKKILPFGKHDINSPNTANNIGICQGKKTTIVYHLEKGIIGSFDKSYTIDTDTYIDGFSSTQFNASLKEKVTVFYDLNGKQTNQLKPILNDTAFTLRFYGNQVLMFNNSGQEIWHNKDSYSNIYGLERKYEPNYNRIPILKDSLFGYIDTLGHQVIPFIYKKADRFRNGLAEVTLPTNKQISINISGKMVTDTALYERLVGGYSGDENKYPCILVEKDGKCGVFNHIGKLILPIDYPCDSIKNVDVNYPIIFGKNGKQGIIDRNGKILFPIEYDEIWGDDFITLRKGKNYSLIDTCGIELLHDTTYYLVQGPNIGGYIKPLDGNENTNYDKMGRDISSVAKKEHYIGGTYSLTNYTYTNYNGVYPIEKVSIPLIYDKIVNIGDKGYLIQQDSLWGLVDKKNNTLIPPQYDDIYYPYYHKNTLVVRKKGNWGTVSLTGKPIIPTKYKSLRLFPNDLVFAEVPTEEKYTHLYEILNKKGEKLLPAQYNVRDVNIGIFPFQNIELKFGEKHCGEGYEYHDHSAIRIAKDNKWGAINTKGELVIPIEYDQISGFNEGIARVYKDSLFGYKNNKGELTVPIIYKEIRATAYTPSTIAIYQGKYGLLNAYGKPAIPFVYDKISYYNNPNDIYHSYNFYKATLNNKTYHYDLNGNCLDCPKD